MACQKHGKHQHVHSSTCGHTRITHNDHLDYLHNGHLHHQHNGHYDEHKLEVTDLNPQSCHPVECSSHHHLQETIPHGDHVDYIVKGRLHHRHGDHCDDHGPVYVLKQSA